jgi:hypothetical protein
VQQTGRDSKGGVGEDAREMRNGDTVCVEIYLVPLLVL